MLKRRMTDGISYNSCPFSFTDLDIGKENTVVCIAVEEGTVSSLLQEYRFQEILISPWNLLGYGAYCLSYLKKKEGSLKGRSWMVCWTSVGSPDDCNHEHFFTEITDARV